MGLPDFIYTGIPQGVDKTASLIVLVINIIAPGIGTIISAFLATECKSPTVWMGVIQILTTPIFGLGLIWAIIWSVRLYRTSGDTAGDEESPLIQRGSGDGDE